MKAVRGQGGTSVEQALGQGGGFRLNKRLVIGIGVIVLAVAYLLVNGLRDNMAYYLEVHEVVDRQASLSGQRVRMGGNIVNGSLISNMQTLERSFVLEQGGATIPVQYTGPVPDIFGDFDPETNSQVLVIVEGQMHGDGAFHATSLQAQCPSRMQAKLAAANQAKQSGTPQ